MYVDYQQRAAEFAVGDSVSSPSAAAYHLLGTVVAVYPAIGMVDVEWPNGAERLPVEDLQRYVDGRPTPPASEHDNVPGGAAKVSVPGGPKTASVVRVAEDFVKKAVYWAAPNRQYRATRIECESGQYVCPNCKTVNLRPANYKRFEGASVRLLACPECLFLVCQEDVIGHPEYIENAAPVQKVAQIRQRTTGVL
jgi:hypothetical protein